MAVCTWDSSKHGGQPCPTHGASGTENNIKNRTKVTTKDGKNGRVFNITNDTADVEYEDKTRGSHKLSDLQALDEDDVNDIFDETTEDDLKVDEHKDADNEEEEWKTTKMASGTIHEIGDKRIIEEENEKGDTQYRIDGTNGQVFSSLEEAKEFLDNADVNNEVNSGKANDSIGNKTAKMPNGQDMTLNDFATKLASWTMQEDGNLEIAASVIAQKYGISENDALDYLKNIHHTGKGGIE